MPTNFDCIELNPGVYYGGWDIGTKVRVTLKPAFTSLPAAGSRSDRAERWTHLRARPAPAPVLIYSTDNPVYKASCPGNAKRCQGNLDLTASSDLKLAPLLASQPCPPVTTVGGCPFGGMVIWMAWDGSRPAGTTGNPSCANFGCVDIEGGGTLFISGTIYAPTANVDIEGHAGTNCGTGSETQKASVQVIAWEFRIGGTGDLCMPYDPSLLYKLTQQGLVH